MNKHRLVTYDCKFVSMSEHENADLLGALLLCNMCCKFLDSRATFCFPSIAPGPSEPMQRARAIVLIALATSVIAPGGEIGDAASQTNEAEAPIFSEPEVDGYATLNAAEKAVSEVEEKAASEVAIAAAAKDAEEMELKAAAKRLRRLRKNQKMEEEATAAAEAEAAAAEAEAADKEKQRLLLATVAEARRAKAAQAAEVAAEAEAADKEKRRLLQVEAEVALWQQEQGSCSASCSTTSLLHGRELTGTMPKTPELDASWKRMETSKWQENMRWSIRRKFNDVDEAGGEDGGGGLGDGGGGEGEGGGGEGEGGGSEGEGGDENAVTPLHTAR